MPPVIASLLLIATLLALGAGASDPVNNNSADNDRNAKAGRQLDIDDLLKSLESRVNDAEKSEKMAGERLKGGLVKPNSDVQADVLGLVRDAEIPIPPLNYQGLAGEKKLIEQDDLSKELLREADDTIARLLPATAKVPSTGLTDEQQQEMYFLAFLRLNNLLRRYRKEQGEKPPDARTTRTVGYLDKQLELIKTKFKSLIENKREAGTMSEEASDEYVYLDKYDDTVMSKAADLIEKLAKATRRMGDPKSKGRSKSEDKEADREAVGIALELVGTVTSAVAGDNVKSKSKPKGKSSGKPDVDVVVRAKTVSLDDSDEEEPPLLLLSNAGFDFVGRAAPDGYAHYHGHPSHYSRGRCGSCVQYDLADSDECTLCKRSEHVYQGRDKRLTRQPEAPLMYHLQRFSGRPSGASWRDNNKLYNFDELNHDKYIDLSMNCTEGSAQPNCQRLGYQLVVPKDAEPVPLLYVRDFLSQGRDLARDMHERARGLQADAGLHPAPHSASMLHFLNNRVSDDAIELNVESQLVLFGTKVLQEKLLNEYKLTPNTFLEFLAHHGFRVTGSKVCRVRHKRCNGASKFRSIDGSCNNFRHPSWGQSNTAFVRILPARYSDGIHALATSASGGSLPNPRLLSTRLFSRRNASDASLTLALVQWGQLIAHDFARQVIDQTPNGGIECCESSGAGPLPRSRQHHSCSPISVPDSDGFYSRHNVSCMNFVRSMTVAREDCSLGPANQLNGVSSFLDLSPIYGSDAARNQALRENQGGRMRTETRSNRVMMPTSAKSGFCDARTDYDVCYETGDARTNQNPQLVILQTLLIREHNRLADELSALNPHWSDERLFQESRHIVIAQYQHVTYRHWLPLVLGKRYCIEHEIFPRHNGLSDDYDVRVNPGIINSFTSAAFRFLHSLIEGTINLVADNYGTSGTLRLSNHYFRPQIVEPNKNFESLLRGLVYQTMQKADTNFHSEITEYLFRSDNEYGMDLEAIDIQRGRDHGLPGYNAYREICQLGRAKDFYGLINEISLSNVEKLENIYEHVDDIDLLVGATMENRLTGSLLGPTLQCLIGEQFYRSRVGDKYFYNNMHFQHSFTPEQFEEIKKASLATWVCDLGEATYQVQLNPFKVASSKNPTMPCFNLPRINLELWKETQQYE